MKPEIVKEIERLFPKGFQLHLPKNNLDPLKGVMGAQKGFPKYTLDKKGQLIGLNLAMTKLDDAKWEKIVGLLEKHGVQLQALDLNENQLAELPRSANLAHLSYLDIDDNPLESIPEETLRQGKGAVLRFWNNLMAQGARELFEVKILIVGEGGTGKTTLWNLLQDPDHPVPDPGQESTVGIQIREGWKFQHIDRPDDEFLANLWDFGGQEVQYMTHQFFLTRRSFYVLLADGRQEIANFPYWLQIIELLGCEPKEGKTLPVLVVLNEKGNPIAKMPYDPVTVEKDYKKLRIIRMEVDFGKKDDGRIEALTKIIQKTLCREIDHLPLTVPAFWDNVRQRLYTLLTRKPDPANHINAETFAQICEEEGVREKQEQDDLSQLLHDLGIILHFREDMDLEDFIILNPQWAVNAVYEIMKHEEVKTKNQGRFDQKLLRRVWTARGYTPEEQRKLLNLMLKDNLEVCFRATENHKLIYIAPQLLPAVRPEGLEWKETPETLRYIYHYPFMPKGIIGRLIVRLHEHIESRGSRKIVWENGAVIRKEHCRAQVQFIDDKDQGRQIIKIEVQGETAEDRKNVLRDIRQELDGIHRRSFPSLRVFQKVPCNCAECERSVDPFEHDFSRLQANKEKHGAEARAQCGITFENVPVQKLLEGVFKEEEVFHKAAFPSRNQPDVHIHIEGPPNQNLSPNVVESQNYGNNNSDGSTTQKEYWWIPRLAIAFFAGLAIAYLSSKYLSLHFYDTWLAAAAIIAIVLLARNPNRRFYRAGYFVLGVLSMINILPQFDILISSKSQVAEGPQEWFFKLGVQDEPLLSVGLLALAGFLFFLDSRKG